MTRPQCAKLPLGIDVQQMSSFFRLLITATWGRKVFLEEKFVVVRSTSVMCVFLSMETIGKDV